MHYTSGVANHFFYLLAEGSGAQDLQRRRPHCADLQRRAVAGIGRAKAGEDLVSRADLYFTSSTSYAGARVATLNAAKDLYGTGSAEAIAVNAAWAAVGVTVN